jgi:hypothetical protein
MSDTLDIGQEDQATFADFLAWVNNYNDYIVNQYNTKAIEKHADDEVSIQRDAALLSYLIMRHINDVTEVIIDLLEFTLIELHFMDASVIITVSSIIPQSHAKKICSRQIRRCVLRRQLIAIDIWETRIADNSLEILV